MEADATREFAVPASGCGVPVAAQAYVTREDVLKGHGFLRCGVPVAAQAYVTNATVVPPGCSVS